MHSVHPHSVVLLSSSFQYPDRRLFFTRARLFFDRIELSGWHFGKKHQQRIHLDAVEAIDWDVDASSAVFHFRDGAPIHLKLPRLDSWQHSLEQRLTWNTTASYPTASFFSTLTSRLDEPLQELVTYATSMG